MLVPGNQRLPGQWSVQNRDIQSLEKIQKKESLYSCHDGYRPGVTWLYFVVVDFSTFWFLVSFFFPCPISLTPEELKVEKHPRKQSNSALSHLKKKKKICSLLFFPMSSLSSSIPIPTPAQSSRGKEVMERTCNHIPKDLSSNDALLPLNISGPVSLSVKRNKSLPPRIFVR